jgi:hypothetical protein
MFGADILKHNNPDNRACPVKSSWSSYLPGVNPVQITPRRSLLICDASFGSGSKQPLKERAIRRSNEAFKLAHKPRRGWNCASNEGMWREKDGETSLLISPFGNLHIGMSEPILCVLRASSEAGGE